MSLPRSSTVMRYARTTQFNWPDMSHCGVRQELTCPSSYVPTTRFLMQLAWKESRFWIQPRDPDLKSGDSPLSFIDLVRSLEGATCKVEVPVRQRPA